jgi:hypothetical protein
MVVGAVYVELVHMYGPPSDCALVCLCYDLSRWLANREGVCRSAESARCAADLLHLPAVA